MKKSEVISAAILKIESLRPSCDTFINAYLESGLDCGFVGSEFDASFNAAYDVWYVEHKSLVTHLNVALSVAIADEYLRNMEGSNETQVQGDPK